MEQMGYKQSDLGNVVGFKGRASEILNKKRKLSLDQIRKINISFNIPVEVLLKAYWWVKGVFAHSEAIKNRHVLCERHGLGSQIVFKLIYSFLNDNCFNL
jgi:hypothetical protein